MNKKFIFMLVAALFVPALSYAQQADPAQDPYNHEYKSHRFALAGKKSNFGGFYSLKPDCSLVDWVQVWITKSPENGEAKLVDGTTTPNYTAPNPRVKCNDKAIKASTLEYTPTKGYAGPDSMRLNSSTAMEPAPRTSSTSQ